MPASCELVIMLHCSQAAIEGTDGRMSGLSLIQVHAKYTGLSAILPCLDLTLDR